MAGWKQAAGQSAELERYFYGLDSTLARYAQGFEQSRLYLHTDKAVYSANEIIWFSTYLLADESDPWPHQVLYVHLVRHGDDSLVRSAQYLIRENRSHGDILIPNLTPPGDYRLIAYTDKLVGGVPALLYQQRLQIRRSARPPFTLTATLRDSSGYHPDTLFLHLQYKPAVRAEGKTPVCQYDLFSNGRRVDRGKLMIGYDGKAQLSLPRSWAENKSLRLRCRIEPAVEGTHTTELDLAYVSHRPRLRFFPEGGSLVINTRGLVALELVTGNGQPLSAPVDILAGDSSILTATTNREGTALFPLIPETGITYTALLRYQGNEYRFPLPAAQPQGHTLQVLHGQAADTFRVRIARDRPGIQVKLLLHNFKQLYWAAEIKSGLAETSFPVPLADVPDGVYAFTLLDEENRPVAERLVMRSGHGPVFRILPTKNKFSPRDTASFMLQWNGPDSGAVGSFSVSCTELSRLPAELTGNILDTWFLADRFDRPLFNQLQLFRDGQPDAEKLDALLLTRGWRRYRWEEINSPAVLPQPTALLPGRGRVIAAKKKKGPFELVIFNPAELKVVTTDSSGFFEIPASELVNETRRKLFLAPYKSKREFLQVWLDTLPEHILNKRSEWPVPALSSRVKTEYAFNDNYLELPFGIKVLEEVVVGGKRTEKFISKDCQDYICHNYVLNCEVHPGGTGIPLPGEIYTYRFRPGEAPQQVEYVGCEGIIAQPPRDFIAIPGINVAKEFYAPDLSKSSPDVPEYHTTLYWNPVLKLRAGETFRPSFYTSDWKGRFRITVEGLTPNGPVHAEQEFTVE